MAVGHGRTIVPSEPDPEIDIELDLDIAAELSLVPRDRLNVRSVRSPATVLRTLGARGPASPRFFFGPFRTPCEPGIPHQGAKFALLRPCACQWRRWESNPRPRSRMNGFYERSRRSDLIPR